MAPIYTLYNNLVINNQYLYLKFNNYVRQNVAQLILDSKL